jgi:alkanesulfonate monooxygenase SsuD/methylene tetrahydromethanopterin reductase-like flavin-dependent oxidoreductase (luciferase family)
MPKRAKRPLGVGLMLPTFEGTMAGKTPRWNDLSAMARHAEAAGFDSLWVADHMLLDYGEPDVAPHGAWDGWMVLASLASITTHIELGTFVACTAFRNPAQLAKSADTLEEISGGRLILGLGPGYHEPEFRAFGHPFDHLVGRFEEAMQIIHTLLRKGTIDFKGQYYEARDCELRPRGPRPGGPPIMIGARPNRPRMLRLTAQYADYWNIFAANRPEDLISARDAIDAACVKAGRDPATLRRTVGMLVDLPGAEDGPAMESWSRYRSSRMPANGAPEELTSLMRTLASEGVDHVQIWLHPFTLAGIDVIAQTLERLDRE